MTAASNGTIVRRIRADEGHVLRDLRLRSLADSPEAFGQPLDEEAGRPDLEWHRSAMWSCRGDRRAWLFAERGREIVGLVQGRRRRPATLLLFSMWVDPGARRLGVGRELIAALEGWARGWRASETVLWVFRGNHRAVNFYLNLGFEPLEAGADAESGVRYDALAMRRRIVPA
jgi:GNAT superfamily N-acetyltransferase